MEEEEEEEEERTNERLNEGDRGEEKRTSHSGIEHRSSPRCVDHAELHFSTIYTRDLNISRDNAFVYVKKCRRVLLERRRRKRRRNTEERQEDGVQDGVRGSVAKREQLSVSRETQARSSSVDPYPPARPGYLCHLSSAPGYLLASVLLLYALFRHMLNARSRMYRRELAISVQRERKEGGSSSGVLLYSSRAFPIAGDPPGVARPRGRKAEKEKCKRQKGISFLDRFFVFARR